MPTIAPTIPPEPTDSDPLEKWVHYRWAVSEANRVALAEAQAATAAALANNAAQQAALVAEMGKPIPPGPVTKADIVRVLMQLMPMRATDTEASYGKAINDQAARLLAALNA